MMFHKKAWGVWKRWVIVCAGTACAVGEGCLPAREFRTAATPAIQEGVSTILNGLLDGFFAAVQPDPQTEAEQGF